MTWVLALDFQTTFSDVCVAVAAVAALATVTITVSYARQSITASRKTLTMLSSTAADIRVASREARAGRELSNLQAVAHGVAEIAMILTDNYRRQEVKEADVRPVKAALSVALSAFPSGQLPECKALAGIHVKALVAGPADTWVAAERELDAAMGAQVQVAAAVGQ